MPQAVLTAVTILLSATAPLAVVGQLQSFTANGAQVNYFQQNPAVQSQTMVMQVQQTTTVTYISAPMSSPLSQFVVNNPQGLVRASQRANQRMQDLAIQAASFKRLGLDSQRSDRTCGRHTIFIATKPAAVALMDDKTLIDFLLDEIFRAMGLTSAQQAQVMKDVAVYNKQGNSPDPATPVFATVAPRPTLPPAPTARPSGTNLLTCQSSLELKCDATARFRTPDGTCNNLQHNLWGSSFTPHRRFLPPAYDDGISAPRTTSRQGGPLPSARLVSVMMHPTGPDGVMTTLTHLVMQWGQFLDHDLTSTPIQIAADGSALTCCEDEMPQGSRGFVDVSNRSACFPIPIPNGDPHFVGRRCFSFPRSVQVTNAKCQQTPVEQLNQLTSYIDASMVYGSSIKDFQFLRTFTGGQLRTSGVDLLPRDTQESCVLNNPAVDYCFKAGDGRANEQMALSSIHTVFLRLHNRLVAQLTQLNPHWDDERLFQEARKIVGALTQKITYNDWLPLLLDRSRVANLDLEPLGPGRQSNAYDPTVDASIRNVFATAVLRFGHSLIRGTLSMMTHNYHNEGSLRLASAFGNTSQILSTQGLGVDMYMRGLVRDPPNMVDRFFTAEIQNHLFQDRTGNSLDLLAFNIQRGRDHGLPAYNNWRRFCGLAPVTAFSNMPQHDPETAQRFSQVYAHPDDIDVFSGIVSERPEGSGLLGPTLACLLSQQFSFLKHGDRFWFETNDPNAGFTIGQLDEIRKHGLARIMCDTTTINQIQPNPFRQVSLGNPLMNCQDIPEMNLAYWQEGGRGLEAFWGMWASWSECDGGLQIRQRSCSQGGNVGACNGQSQESRPCGDSGFTTTWAQWSAWSADCVQGFQRRTRICQGFGSPCQGVPQQVRICRRNSGSDDDNNNSNKRPGWGDWQAWSQGCSGGKQWRTRTCNRPGNGNQLGVCSGPSSESRGCDSAPSGLCGYFNVGC